MFRASAESLTNRRYTRSNASAVKKRGDSSSEGDVGSYVLG
jgi:hypothetical protein